MTVAPVLLQVREVSRLYGTDGATTALKRVDVDIARGEFVAIMGPSGAGKSTLLNVLGLLDEPTTGSYVIDGRNAENLTDSQRDKLRSETFSFVFQASQVLPYETVEFNAALGLSIKCVPRRARADRVRMALEQVGLSHRVGALARELSGGERQRLAIARAIATEPQVLFADEPTGNLDSANTDAVMTLLAGLSAAGVTIVLITHDPHVASFASRTLRLVDGTLTDAGIGSERDVAVASEEQSRIRRPFAASAERLSDALSTITSRPTRSVALIAAFLLGVGGLVAATGIGATASQQVADRLTASALDEMYVFNPAEATRDQLGVREAVLSSLPRVEDVALRIPIERNDADPAMFPSGPVSGQPELDGQTIGSDSDLFRLSEATVSPGNALDIFDDPRFSDVAIVGSSIAEQLGFDETGEGRQLYVLGRQFTIVGIVSDPGRYPSLSTSILIPTRAVPDLPSEFVVRTQPGFPAALADSIPVALDPGNPGAVSVSTVGDLRNLRVGVAGDLSTLVGVTGAILLAMAVLSAGTAMYLSVQARQQEIALRRALGLSRTGAVTIFLIEGTLLGLAGGLAGLAIGLSAVVVIAVVQGWSAIIPVYSIATGLIAGAAGGALSSVIPALHAARIEPADAIR